MNTFIPAPDDPAGSLRVLLAEGRFAEVLEEYWSREGERTPDASLMAATASTRLGDLPMAADLAGQALDRFRARADDDGRMRTLNLLGVIEFERGNLDRSRYCFTETLGLARALKDTLMTARACNNLASIADLQGDGPGALTLYRSALLSYQRLGDRRGTAESYHNLGIVFRQMENWGEALSASDQAIRHAATLAEQAILGLAVMGRAEIDLHRGEREMARQGLEWAAVLAERGGDELGVIEVNLLRASLAGMEQDWPRATREAEQARNAAIAARAAVLQAQCAAVSAVGFKAVMRLDEAVERKAEAERLFRAQGAIRRLAEFGRRWEATTLL